MPGRALVAGHLCLDLTPAWAAAPPAGEPLVAPGRLAEVGPLGLSAGGAVANTGLALARLGVPVRLAARLGSDPAGRLLREVLARRGARAGLKPAPGAATSYTVVLDPPGRDRAFLHFPGANTGFAAGDVEPGAMAGADLLHLGYPPLLPALLDAGAAGLRELLGRARRAGLTTSVDMVMVDPRGPSGSRDWPALLAAFLPLVDLFLPGLEELEALLDRDRFLARPAADPLGSYTAAEAAALGRSCLELGARTVVVKMGTRGLLLLGGDHPPEGRALASPGSWRGRELWMPALKARRVAGTKGAGDAAVAGLLAAVLRGLSPEESLSAAAAAGSLCVEEADAVDGIRGWDEVRGRAAAGESLPGALAPGEAGPGRPRRGPGDGAA